MNGFRCGAEAGAEALGGVGPSVAEGWLRLSIGGCLVAADEVGIERGGCGF